MPKLKSAMYPLIGVLLLASAISCSAEAATNAPANGNPVLVGRVTKVTDGDTLDVELASGPITVRLHSIDTPEGNQPYGRAATAALYSKAFGKTVQLEVVEQDRYDRQVAVVYVNGANVNASMVQEGHAWAYRDYLDDHDFCRWEGAARASRIGIWALPVKQQVAPWEWRDFDRGEVYAPTEYAQWSVEDCIRAAGHRTEAAPAAPAAPAVTSCRIKGNISDNGKIYHVPGSRGYSDTRIDTSKGERWFCTEEEAKAQGWKAPRG
jgi:endonuclease YncB( thermonuclease family)